MAVYHLECRIAADPSTPNPPARVAKWSQACALPSCQAMIWKGDMISCTRDNVNGQRKGAREEPAPTTQREPHAPKACAELPSEADWVPRQSLDCARRLLEQERAKVNDLQNVLRAIELAIVGAK